MKHAMPPETPDEPIQTSSAGIGDTAAEEGRWQVREGVLEPALRIAPRPEGVEALTYNNS